METFRQYSNLFPRHLCGLGVIFDHAFAAQNLSTLLNIAGRDIIDFFKKSSYLTPLRMNWEKTANKHMSLMKKVEKRLILKIKQVYREISNRVLVSDQAENPVVKRHLNFIDDILSFKYFCGSTPFYVLALGMLNGLCNELIKQKQMSIVEGLAEFEPRSYADNRTLTGCVCEKERKDFAELHSSLKPNKCLAWQSWFFLNVLKDCLNFSNGKFSTIQLPFLTEEESLQGATQLQRFAFWNDLKLALKDDKAPLFFTAGHFINFLETLIRQIFIREAGEKQHKNEKIHSLALKLSGEEFRLVVNRNDGCSSDIYILKEFEPGSDPILFINAILEHPGKKIELQSIPCYQAISKLIQRSNLKGILADIFIPYRRKGVVMLYAQEILFSELQEREKLLIYELLPNLKPYSF